MTVQAYREALGAVVGTPQPPMGLGDTSKLVSLVRTYAAEIHGQARVAWVTEAVTAWAKPRKAQGQILNVHKFWDWLANGRPAPLMPRQGVREDGPAPPYHRPLKSAPTVNLARPDEIPDIAATLKAGGMNLLGVGKTMPGGDP